ncbi:unnamed protein product [Caenorhabditis bovis]|uniref:T20D4.11-like domain-containing protein n=1 Tax=Caenorhabditis bovis TaxID=2654633 RepID=A0A8S1FCV1_9PELO|nr:unnamed protein product [Caenorhabditis bovis]
MFRRILLCTLIATTALGFSDLVDLYIRRYNQVECNLSDDIKDLWCSWSYYFMKSANLSANGMSLFITSCRSFEKCIESKACGEGEEVETNKKFATSIGALCNIYDFLEYRFKECGLKLKNVQRGTCFDDFMEKLYYVDQNTTSDGLLPICKGYYGKDDCLNIQIKENCGEEMFIKFEENVIKNAMKSATCVERDDD